MLVRNRYLSAIYHFNINKGLFLLTLHLEVDLFYVSLNGKQVCLDASSVKDRETARLTQLLASVMRVILLRGRGEAVDARVVKEHDLHVLLKLLHELSIDLLRDLASLLLLLFFQ